MSNASARRALWGREMHAAFVIAKKNALLYYLQPPVLMFGVLFPVFFFFTFVLGRGPAGLDPEAIVPGMLAMALWFTASAVGPLVTPWERRARTYERLISTPISLKAVVAGDVLSGFVFGVALSLVPLVLGGALTAASICDAPLVAAGIALGALAFASLGVLLAAPPVTSPSQIMMLSNLVRLPLLFLSGIFRPIAQMPGWARTLAPISPLSYASDLIRQGYGQPGYFPVWLDLLALLGFAAVLVTVSCWFHRRTRAKGL